MSELPFFYNRVSPTTWVHLSSLLTIAIFFKFSRLWSIRNLDLIALILVAPGLLAAQYGHVIHSVPTEQAGYLWLFAATLWFLVRTLLDPMMVRRPLLEPNLSVGGLAFLGIALFVFLMANVLTGLPAPEEHPVVAMATGEQNVAAEDPGGAQDPSAESGSDAVVDPGISTEARSPNADPKADPTGKPSTIVALEPMDLQRTSPDLDPPAGARKRCPPACGDQRSGTHRAARAGLSAAICGSQHHHAENGAARRRAAPRRRSAAAAGEKIPRSAADAHRTGAAAFVGRGRIGADWVSAFRQCEDGHCGRSALFDDSLHGPIHRLHSACVAGGAVGLGAADVSPADVVGTVHGLGLRVVVLSAVFAPLVDQLLLATGIVAIPRRVAADVGRVGRGVGTLGTGSRGILGRRAADIRLDCAANAAREFRRILERSRWRSWTPSIGCRFWRRLSPSRRR